MFSSESGETQRSNHNKTVRPYFFARFEKEVQVAFDKISRLANVPPVPVNIMKGSIYLKGDYFIPLKGSNFFQLNCKELLEMLESIPFVSSVEVDSNFNLILCLFRHEVYKSALLEVIKDADSYGMMDMKSSILVVTDIENGKSFNNLRNSLIAEHIISILAANNMKVYYSDCSSKLECSASLLSCSSDCSLTDICRRLKDEIKISEWKSDTQVYGSTCLDANRYIICHGLLDKYGKAIEGIIVPDEGELDDLQRTCHVKHLIDDHMRGTPDYILHIASQGQNRIVYKSGVLLGMLEDYRAIQVYVFNQSVQNKDKAVSADDFINEHRLEIEKAMSHKYDTYNSTDPTWASRIQSLTDTAVKFDYLKLNHSSILNLRAPSSRQGEKNYGVFVQYNYARLSNLFKNFQEKVDEGYYLPLAPIEEVEFGLLKLEEEWNLFHYVLSFPGLVSSLVSSLLPPDEAKLRFRLNKVCVMLQELCQNWSLYYSRIRILSGPQAHLQKVMNARLWLLKGIHQIFKSSFILLNVRGLDQM